MIRIAYDTTPGLMSRSGVGRYSVELQRALRERGDIELVELHSPGAASTGGGRANRIGRGLARELVYYPGRLGHQARRVAADVLHVPGPFPARSRNLPVLLTVHDAIPWRHPGLFTGVNRFHQQRLLEPAARAATRVLTGSHHSARELVELLGVEPERVAVTPLGVSARFRPAPPEPELLARRFGITSPFVLAVGTLEPRKNLVTVVQAFALLLASGAAHGHELVLAGGRGWHGGELERVLEDAPFRPIATGHVDDDDLIALYSAAACFVYPSLHEGFGLPPLEAMACGAPVVVADNSSLPEVVAEAGVLVEATDPAAIAAAVQWILGNQALRDTLRARGLARARELSWERCAAATVTVYCEALADVNARAANRSDRKALRRR